MTTKKAQNCLFLILLAPFLFNACNSKAISSPSQNSALNKISQSSASKKEKGFMQKSLDNWLEKDWSPKVAQDPKIQEKYMIKKLVPKKITSNNESKIVYEEVYIEDPNRKFTLQEYVDKAGVYMDSNSKNYENSHVNKLNNMRVIGKE